MKKVIVITGGSRGIGASTALLAGKQRYNVCVNYYRNQSAADAVVETIEEQGGRAIAVAADVSSQQQVVRLFEKVDDSLGPVTALVNNAGILARITNVRNMDAKRINHIFSVNVTGSFLCAREAIRRMSKKLGGSGGSIVNLSSAAARLGSPNEFVDYAASKAAIDTMTIGLAKEVGEEGIRVNAVRPGLIRTEMHADAGDPDRADKLKADIPMKRPGETFEVAKAIMWLLSDEASYCSGALLDVSGGR